MIEDSTVLIRIGRNRSGFDAGCIDMEVAVDRVEDLCEADYKELLRTIDAAKNSCKRARFCE
jgi:hypothetical protein